MKKLILKEGSPVVDSLCLLNLLQSSPEENRDIKWSLELTEHVTKAFEGMEELDVSKLSSLNVAELVITSANVSPTLKHILLDGFNEDIANALIKLPNLDLVTIHVSNRPTYKEISEIYTLTNIVSEKRENYNSNLVEKLCVHDDQYASGQYSFPKSLAEIIQEYVSSEINFEFSYSDHPGITIAG